MRKMSRQGIHDIHKLYQQQKRMNMYMHKQANIFKDIKSSDPQKRRKATRLLLILGGGLIGGGLGTAATYALSDDTSWQNLLTGAGIGAGVGALGGWGASALIPDKQEQKKSIPAAVVDAANGHPVATASIGIGGGLLTSAALARRIYQNGGSQGGFKRTHDAVRSYAADYNSGVLNDPDADTQIKRLRDSGIISTDKNGKVVLDKHGEVVINDKALRRDLAYKDRKAIDRMFFGAPNNATHINTGAMTLIAPHGSVGNARIDELLDTLQANKAFRQSGGTTRRTLRGMVQPLERAAGYTPRTMPNIIQGIASLFRRRHP